MADSDELYAAVNNFWVGNYTMALEEVESAAVSSDALKIELQVIKYRSMIAQGRASEVLDSIGGAPSSTAVAALSHLAAYTAAAGKGAQAESALEQLKKLQEDSTTGENSTLKIVMASIMSDRGEWEEALKAIHGGVAMEHSALRVQILLKMNRFDLAEKEVKSMTEKDDDSTLAQLCSAWFACLAGKAGSRDKMVNQASYTFQELVDKFGVTTMLYNSLAVCHIHMKRYDEARALLNELIDSEDDDRDTLVNLIVCEEYSGGNVTEAREKLQSKYPDDPFVQRAESLAKVFEDSITNGSFQ